jgi:hypothetical protein
MQLKSARRHAGFAYGRGHSQQRRRSHERLSQGLCWPETSGRRRAVVDPLLTHAGTETLEFGFFAFDFAVSGPEGHVRDPGIPRVLPASRPLGGADFAASDSCDSSGFMGRAGFEPAALGLRVRSDEPRRAATRCTELHPVLRQVATNYARCGNAETNLYAQAYAQLRPRNIVESFSPSRRRRTSSCRSFSLRWPPARILPAPGL